MVVCVATYAKKLTSIITIIVFTIVVIVIVIIIVRRVAMTGTGVIIAI